MQNATNFSIKVATLLQLCFAHASFAVDLLNYVQLNPNGKDGSSNPVVFSTFKCPFSSEPRINSNNCKATLKYRASFMLWENSSTSFRGAIGERALREIGSTTVRYEHDLWRNCYKLMEVVSQKCEAQNVQIDRRPYSQLVTNQNNYASLFVTNEIGRTAQQRMGYHAPDPQVQGLDHPLNPTKIPTIGGKNPRTVEDWMRLAEAKNGFYVIYYSVDLTLYRIAVHLPATSLDPFDRWIALILKRNEASDQNATVSQLFEISDPLIGIISIAQSSGPSRIYFQDVESNTSDQGVTTFKVSRSQTACARCHAQGLRAFHFKPGSVFSTNLQVNSPLESDATYAGKVERLLNDKLKESNKRVESYYLDELLNVKQLGPSKACTSCHAEGKKAAPISARFKWSGSGSIENSYLAIHMNPRRRARVMHLLDRDSQSYQALSIFSGLPVQKRIELFEGVSVKNTATTDSYEGRLLQLLYSSKMSEQRSILNLQKMPDETFEEWVTTLSHDHTIAYKALEADFNRHKVEQYCHLYPLPECREIAAVPPLLKNL